MTRIYLIIAALLVAQGAAAQQMDGQAIFKKNCAACHLATGRGIPGAFPALAGSALVQGEPSELATVLLKGRGGMPDFSASMADQDIALVLTYARASWGNKGAPVAADDIAALREKLQVAKASASRLANKH